MARNFRARRSGLVVRGGTRRESVWIGVTPVLSTLTAVGGTITNILNAAALALRPFTVVRVRGELYIRSDQEANSEDQLAAYGMAVVSEQAASVGVTAVPTPSTDESSDLFFMHQWCFNSIRVVSAASVFQTGTRYSIDSRAMRKVDTTQDIAFVAEKGPVGAGVVLTSGFRMLVKLH